MEQRGNSGCDWSAMREFVLNATRIEDGTRPRECVYHYTRPDVLNEFLKDGGDFLCTHFRALNDTREFLEGLDYVLGYMRRRNWHSSLIEKFIKYTYLRTQFDWSIPWIMSFSSLNDSLYQWRSYTDECQGGYAIGFESSAIEKFRNANLWACNQIDRTPVSVFFSPCWYRGLENDVIEEWCEKFFSEVPQGELVSGVLTQGHETLLHSLALILAMLIKNRAFYFEQEQRLALVHNFPDAYRDVISVDGKPRMWANVPRVIGPLRDIIRSVIISPHGNRNVLYANALSLKMKYGAKYNIVFSEAPFNGDGCRSFVANPIRTAGG